MIVGNCHRHLGFELALVEIDSTVQGNGLIRIDLDRKLGNETAGISNRGLPSHRCLGLSLPRPRVPWALPAAGRRIFSAFTSRCTSGDAIRTGGGY